MSDTAHLTPASPTLDMNAAEQEPVTHTAPGTSEATATAPHVDTAHAHPQPHHPTWKQRVKNVVDVIRHGPEGRNRRASQGETHVFGGSEGSHADKTDRL